MPFVANGQDDEENKNALSPVGGGAVHLAPSSGVGTAAAGGSSAAPQKDAGGSFASLDKYVTANQGQAAPLAGKITGGINDQYNGLNQGNQNVLSSLQGQVTNAPGYTKSDPNVLAQEAANPVSFAGDANNVKSFQSLLNNNYSGPASAEGDSGFQAQQAKVNDAISKGNTLTSTDSGRKQLVQNNSAVPTAGVTALNSAILSQDPNALNQVQNAYKPFGNLVSGLSSGAADIDKTIATEQADATNSRAAAQNAVNGQVSGLGSAVNNELSAAQKAANDKLTSIKSAFSNLYDKPLDTTQSILRTYGGGTTPWANTTNYNVNALSPEAQSALGLNGDQAQQLQDALKAAATSQSFSGHNFGADSGTTQFDLSNYLNTTDPSQAITAANVATPEQYAQAAALKQLLGGNLPSEAVLDPSQAAKAGTAPTKFADFDYNTALSDAQQTAAAERTAAQQEAQGISSAADAAHDASKSHTFGNLLKTVGQGFVNPLLLAPKEIKGAKNVTQKII